ncbi:MULTISPECIES: DNA adenine methylase [Pseudomonas]|uniref:Site-specific DNA-methyltransferase (adenine-specific) n=1 Tax=Pseudomonas aphyarum TaxID=2942629 RepID=A0ABT5PUM5_9PSED|nr:Dam family site-specific DNA-(adenine-N6)-methyltransferase [Pseudomonas aphyarum]MDD0968072.1 Dam family site-specific DNA-(adenine-N6)-methyltransferase [Pseudomonas aphyarum]MDD1127596.1 Dam family site-specific DNA-(adenine-N6)-methyltransferase [Pseudomonas aphyarum]
MKTPKRALIRWAGSKKKLIPVIKKSVPLNFDRYIEPFCGSISLFLELPPSKAILSDINEELINFYNVVKVSPTYISDELAKLESSKENYYRVRGLNPEALTRKERAVRFFYLNRHCFNGVYRTNQKGMFNVPYGSKLSSVPSACEVMDFSRFIKNATFEKSDFERVINKAGFNDFIYLDPPYAGRNVKDRGEYGQVKFAEVDIERLHRSLLRASERGAKILLSYADIPLIREVFSEWRIETVSVGRSVSGFSKGRMIVNEVLIKNFDNG